MSVAARTWATSSSGMAMPGGYRPVCPAARPGPGAQPAAAFVLAGRLAALALAGAVVVAGGQHGLGGGQPGHGHPEGGAAHVVEPGLVEDGRSTRGSPPCSPQTPTLSEGLVARPRAVPEAHQLAHPVGVDRLERVARQQAELEVGRHHPALDVVAAEAEGHLGEVVGAEARRSRPPRRSRRPAAPPGGLDHGADGHLEPGRSARLGAPALDGLAPPRPPRRPRPPRPTAGPGPAPRG